MFQMKCQPHCCSPTKMFEWSTCVVTNLYLLFIPALRCCNEHILCCLVGVCVCMCVCSLRWFVCLINAAPFELNSGRNNSKMSSSQMKFRNTQHHLWWISLTPWHTCTHTQKKLGGGFKHFLFSPLFGEDSHFDYFWLIFFKWGLKPLTRDGRVCKKVMLQVFFGNIVVGVSHTQDFIQEIHASGLPQQEMWVSSSLGKMQKSNQQ